MARTFLLFVVFALGASGCMRRSAEVADAPSNEPVQVRPAATAQAPASTTTAPLPPPADELADPAITRKIRASLLLDPALAGSDVSVNTDHGVVSLTGLVSSQEQVAVASAHAQREDGVVRVDNHLAVDLR